MTNRIKLLINWYELAGNNLVGEYEITDMTIDEILALFDAPFWNGSYHCWAIEPQHVPVLQPHIDHIIQPQQYAYFLEAIKINSQLA